MHLFKRIVPVCVMMTCSMSLAAQTLDSTLVKNNSSLHPLAAYPTPQKSHTFAKSILVPGIMVAYGALTLRSDPLQDVDEELQRKIWVEHPHSKMHIDNYLQYAPAVAVYGLNIAGVKGKNNFRDRSIIYFMSNVIMNIAVTPTKHFTHELRPDGSDYFSFPSGHTAEAFLSAEFLRQEYKDFSPWYGIAGYVTAAATGLLRMYNNKHWMNDIIAGAGVGIISTKLAYWIYPAISQKLFHKKESQATILPYYQNKQAGVAMLYSLH